MNKVQQAVLDHLQRFSTPSRPVYLVGGAVRDLLLNRSAHDLDFVLPGPTRKLADEIACQFGGALYVLDEERSTTRVILNPGKADRMLLDFASLRTSQLESDLAARDFTINAMAVDTAHPDQLIDPTGGQADLREKRIRACLPSSLANDPVRVLRAVRQALALQFRIDSGTFQQMRDAAPGLMQVSDERVRDELFRMLEGSHVAVAIRVLDQVGALGYVLPELAALKGVTQSAPHTQDVWEHTLSVVRNLEKLLLPLVGPYQEDTATDPAIASAVIWLGRFRMRFAEHLQQSFVADRSRRGLLFLAALYHDIAKPQTRSEAANGQAHFYRHEEQGTPVAAHRGRALALSAAEVEYIKLIVANHMRVHHLAGRIEEDALRLSRRSIYRFFRDTGEAGVEICLLSLADTLGIYGFNLPQPVWQAELEVCRLLLEAYWERNEQVVSPPRYVSGHDLIQALHLRPGPLIGRLLGAIREAQAVDEVHDRDEALAFAMHWLEEHPNEPSPQEKSKE